LNFEFNDVLKGKRLELIRTIPTLAFSEVLFKTVDSNREHFKPWFPWVNQTLSSEDSYNYLLDKEEKTKRKEIIEYGIYYLNQYIGNISIFDLNNIVKSGEIGYWISKEYTNKGLMTEAVKILEKEFFEHFEFNRLQIKCDILNEASKKVALNCNFKTEGVLREDHFNSYNNNFRSTIVFSKLRSEYFA
jgi:ribosomal-protein-serine acetyltransferase